MEEQSVRSYAQKKEIKYLPHHTKKISIRGINKAKINRSPVFLGKTECREQTEINYVCLYDHKNVDLNDHNSQFH